MTYANDADFLLAVLSDGEWHELNEIIERSFRDRGCGLTVHSRASTLRERGHRVKQKGQRNSRGRVLSFYRLEALNETPAVLSPVDPSAGPRDGVGVSLSASAAGVTLPDAEPSCVAGALSLFNARLVASWDEVAQ